MNDKNKSKHIRVHPEFYKRIERERSNFMKKNGLSKLTTAAFTGILETKLIKIKNAKK